MDKDRKSAVAHGVAGWHTPVRCLQPWASAMGSVPALPQASFESVSKALIPCRHPQPLTPAFLWDIHLVPRPELGDDPVPKMPTVQSRKRARDTLEPLQNTRMLTRQGGCDLETVRAHSPTWRLAGQHTGKHPEPHGSVSSGLRSHPTIGGSDSVCINRMMEATL